jgi:hypothetical protein
LWFAPAKPAEPAAKAKTPRVKVKNDPEHVTAARELRDRYLEQVNSQRLLASTQGKYDVSRALSPVRVPEWRASQGKALPSPLAA